MICEIGPERHPNIEKSLLALDHTFQQFHQIGIESIYLDGSAARSDYLPALSDIDSIALVNGSATATDELTVSAFLLEQFPELDIHMRFFRLRELNRRGKAQREFRSALPPGYLLRRFSRLMFVCGEDYAREDFTRPDFSLDEALDLNLGRITSCSALDPADEDTRVGLVKSALKVYYYHAFPHDDHDQNFDYNLVLEEHDRAWWIMPYEPVKQLLDIRVAGYDEQLFRRQWPGIIAMLLQHEGNSLF